jgi:hypothetical protein
LNHRIVQRLRLMSQVHAHKAMLEFRIGDRVTFEPEGWISCLRNPDSL